MLKDEVIKQISTPLTSPAFPRGPYKFHNREYFNIVYRTDMDALRKVVPEPLEIDEPLVRFEIMAMHDTSGLGCYTESGQAIPVSFNGVKGDYLHMMYLDNEPAIAVGRELSAYPKKLGYPKLFVDSDTLVGTLDYGKLRVATATMGYKHKALDANEAKDQICRPNYMLKIIPNYDGSPRICELINAKITDVTVHEAWTGPTRLQLFDHAMAPLNDLPVKEIVSSSHILADIILPRAEVIYDYLK
ncbi:acetoacetate decarboxylase [Clostridium acetobutylicum]|uniref:Acetoacetate decarboxylase n=2 Tax=Clostridium TaxID=1485 RepID=ADC_CLOAB|nr:MULTISPECIES: acetoacetate decarboxylase [Clostridium]P23670.1 RecName: Full=Acetoacetate decarboxylase; Short=AAD; Short=AADase; Short=ADC [Clostridium acetobutylicum ATCC 824]AHL44285.1 acetoacetate decarboxylase [synthetic construct]AKZ32083.1 acetoacetate decarboxylase [Clostridium sp. BOH3]AAA63761.1 acetoacetate decarboxylase [Clostridium acetobutylicum ATCC 824]AAK76910.1 Acetoacetate decarboxylase [Clostridium acetobutylicum ATCC 824]ADZ22946.1 acetoacetate decarboxylase [Clostridi